MIQSNSLLLQILVITITTGPTLGATLSKTNENNEHHEGQTCLTRECVLAASAILNNMDPSVDPCDDFYQFACGGFLINRQLPDNKQAIHAFSITTDLVQNELRTAVEQNYSSDEPRTFLLLKEFYKTCMNTEAIEANGLTTIKAILKDVGGWPVLEGPNWNECSFDWMESTYKFRQLGLGVNYLLSFDVSADPKNSSRCLINLDQADLGLDRAYLVKGMDDNVVKSYLQYMVNVATVLGADRDLAAKELQDSLKFEVELANISLPPEKRRNVSSLFNILTVEELQHRYSSIPWDIYLSNVLQNTKIKISREDFVVVNGPQYISDLENLLKATPKRIQANYLLWRVIEFSVPYLTQKLNEYKLRLDKMLVGTSTTPERWVNCIDHLTDSTNSLNIAAGALYAREYFSKNAKTQVEEIITNVRTAFTEILEQVDWMDAETKAKALEKLRDISPHVGFANELFDDKQLDSYYSQLALNPRDYLKSILNISLFHMDISFEKLHQPVNKTEWSTRISPVVVNAEYVPSENSIQIPAAILQGSFFGEGRPNYLNYGSLGFTVGHEMTHGFDDFGKQYDKDGNLIKWWTEKTTNVFTKKAQCIIDQYGNITVPEVGMKINGVSTQGENIADNGGIKEAYLAYNAWVDRNGPEPQLPGLTYTPNQLFWVSTASIFCSKQKLQYLKQQILTDPHTPNQFRILVPLSNTDYFAHDFNCPLDSRMNPEHKCNVW